jgi:hypothetical protein
MVFFRYLCACSHISTLSRIPTFNRRTRGGVRLGDFVYLSQIFRFHDVMEQTWRQYLAATRLAV